MVNRSDKNNKDHDEAGDGLLAGLEQLAGELDRQRYPGRVWSGPQRARRWRRLAWWVGPASAIAAAVLLSVMLFYRSSGSGQEAQPASLVSLPSGSETVLASGQTLRPAPTLLDASVLAHMKLGVPNVTLPAPVPAVSRSAGPDSYTWEIPEIQLPEL